MAMAAAVAEQIASLYAPPQAPLDPADADAFADGTAAGAGAGAGRKRAFVDEALTSTLATPGRLRLRASVPVLSGYEGRKVDRSAALGREGASSGPPRRPPPAEEDDDAGDGEEDDDGGGPESGEEREGGPLGIATGAGAAATGFNISDDLEAEYAKMMQSTQHELEVMRVPSAAEVQRKRAEAAEMKRQVEAWNALLEFRIHIEGALSISHRLPVGPIGSAESGAAAKELSRLLGHLLAVQQRAAEGCGVAVPPSPPGGEGGDLGEAEDGCAGGAEDGAWRAVDARLEAVLDWALGVADEWKEKTRLDTRRSFRVLDQSLRSQMAMLGEVDPEKLHRRCTPPPGRYKVLQGPKGALGRGQQAVEGAQNGAVKPAATEEEVEEEQLSHILDDRDFYVQLLREVLASGGKVGEAAEAAQLQTELQSRRANKRKAKKEVDRRASKGRKIRYVPVERLQNFMAPKPRTAHAADAAPGLLPVGGELAASTVDAIVRALFA